jgi:hypothetical protein
MYQIDGDDAQYGMSDPWGNDRRSGVAKATILAGPITPPHVEA